MSEAPKPAQLKTTEPADGGERARMVATVVLCIVAGLFALLNLREVKVNFIVTTARAPLIVVIVACLAVGIALGMLAGRRRSSR